MKTVTALLAGTLAAAGILTGAPAVAEVDGHPQFTQQSAHRHLAACRTGIDPYKGTTDSALFRARGSDKWVAVTGHRFIMVRPYLTEVPGVALFCSIKDPKAPRDLPLRFRKGGWK